MAQNSKFWGFEHKEMNAFTHKRYKTCNMSQIVQVLRKMVNRCVCCDLFNRPEIQIYGEFRIFGFFAPFSEHFLTLKTFTPLFKHVPEHIATLKTSPNRPYTAIAVYGLLGDTKFWC